MQDPLLTLPPPRCQMRRVQPFSTQQRPDLAGRPRRVGLAQDPQLVPHRELPPAGSLQPLRHLGVRPTRPVRHDRRALAFDGAILRRHGLSSFSTLTISSFSGVSPTIDREGLTGATVSPAVLYRRRGQVMRQRPRGRFSFTTESDADVLVATDTLSLLRRHY